MIAEEGIGRGNLVVASSGRELLEALARFRVSSLVVQGYFIREFAWSEVVCMVAWSGAIVSSWRAADSRWGRLRAEG